MKKVTKRKKKQIKKAVLTVVAIVAVIGGYIAAHIAATAERGYETVGGELMILAIPFIAYAIYRNIKDMKK